ncbi:arsenate reductase (glutaredoxin) [Oceanihabitans sp. 2_MG-2023]|uniref:arsenate reductase (glutaredoxin) n=1 Tax=Oceanihabitans sp. 2_MG-2023 TaxID=3062661 RepID=UPI0026E2573D|nr:arsenate reductase (glutaredoxin) [Oceanihabitans sp. 2_MG-2023]MDO6596865.1 arsenate reductase (glutaredoxin) [Oceanihabitans sp. 2_MG-2023]
MITIYHNNRCSKSRSGLEILKNSGKEFKIINYLETFPDKEEIIRIIKLLNIEPIDLVRKNEVIWKENYKNKILTGSQVIDAMVKHPKLIERPIVIKGNKAVIGRPPELILDLIT